MIIKTTIFSISLLIGIACCAQTYLVVDTYRGKQRTEYHTGDEIAFKLKDDSEIYYGVIQSMKKNVVFISEVSVDLNDITEVYVNKKPEKEQRIKNTVNAASKASWIIPAIALLNPIIIDGSDPINEQNVIISALAVASPFYFKSRIKKKAKINKRHRIRMISFDDLNYLPSQVYDTD